MKDFGNTMKRTSRSTQALENRMLMRAVRPTASILVQAAADSALAILMDEEDDGTYVNEIYYIEIYIHTDTYTHTHTYIYIMFYTFNFPLPLIYIYAHAYTHRETQ